MVVVTQRSRGHPVGGGPGTDWVCALSSGAFGSVGSTKISSSCGSFPEYGAREAGNGEAGGMARHVPLRLSRPVAFVTSEEASRIAVSNAKGFDSNAYDRMASDFHRVDQYSRAIAKAVAGKTVLDVGTGRDALLAQICVRAGAAHVTAVEVVPTAAADARVVVARAGFEHRIKVLEGHSTWLPLPKVDIVVHEIVGGLALEEGMTPVLLDLQRRPDVVDSTRPCWSLPRRVETRIAPVGRRVSVDTRLLVGARRSMAAQPSQLSAVRMEVDRLVRVTAPPMETLLGELQVLDALDTETNMEPQLMQERQLRWCITAPAVLEGFACAPWLDLDGEHVVDAWRGGTSWPHKLVGLRVPVEVSPGDEIRLGVTCDLRRFPTRYGFAAELRRMTVAAPAAQACRASGLHNFSY